MYLDETKENKTIAMFGSVSSAEDCWLPIIGCIMDLLAISICDSGDEQQFDLCCGHVIMGAQ